jgi:hypothetical protein
MPLVARDCNSMSESERQAKTAHTVTVAVSSDQRRSTVAVAQDCNSMSEQYERQAKTATDQDVSCAPLGMQENPRMLTYADGC